MTEPLEPLDPTLESLFAEERSACEVPPGAALRLHTRLGPLLLTAVAPPPMSPASIAPSARGGGPALHATGIGLHAVRYLAVLVVGMGAGAAVHAVVAKKPAPTVVYVDRVVSAATSAAPAPMLTTAPSAVALPTAEIAPPLSGVSPAAPHGAGRAPRARGESSNLAAERVGLEIAREALSRGNAGEALAATDKYVRSFPGGQLREEADAIAIQALVQAGRTSEAQARAAQFRQTYPHGLFRAVVDEAMPASPHE